MEPTTTNDKLVLDTWEVGQLRTAFRVLLRVPQVDARYDSCLATIDMITAELVGRPELRYGWLHR